jgi:serine/threonine protein kinase
MAVSLEKFVESLSSTGLMSAEDYRQFQDGIPPEQRATSAKDLARLLCESGKITKFQAQALYEGKSRGIVFGEYVVLDRIGVGGMGQVFRAQHRRMKRMVAVKVLPPAATRSDFLVKRFFREVEAAARLTHANIVIAYDAGEQHGLHYLVMEYVDGPNLSSLVKEQGPLAVPKAIHCIIQAARGLEFAHSQGIIHRDVKPSNLLIDRNGTIKILDMGLARFESEAGREADGEDGLTAAGQVMGTVDYMAPEQAEDTHTADQRSDLYSLGCTLHFLLTGKPPYPAETMVKKILAHRQRPIPNLRELRPEASQDLQAIFQRTIAKRPEERYPSATELLRDLEELGAGSWGSDLNLPLASALDSDDFLEEASDVETPASSPSDAGSASGPPPPPIRATPMGTPDPGVLVVPDPSHRVVDRMTARVRAGNRQLFLMAVALVLVACVIMAVAAYAVLSRQDSPPPPRPPTVLPERRVPEPGADDLLEIVEPLRDRVAGQWDREGDLLRSGDAPLSLIQFPYLNPPEYRLTAEVELTSTDAGLAIGLSLPGTQAAVLLEPISEGKWGLGLVSGAMAWHPAGAESARSYQAGQRLEIVCEVTSGGVAVTCDGEQVAVYAGPLNRLTIPPDLKGAKPRSLFLATLRRGAAIHRLELMPLNVRRR